MCHRALEVSGDWFAYISRTTARQRAGRLGRKLPKIAHLRLRFVCLLNLCLNRDGLERPLPIWAAATDHVANAKLSFLNGVGIEPPQHRYQKPL
jgi:hypothetical protein